MKKELVYLALAGTLLAAFNNPFWTDEDGAAKALKAQNYEPVQVGGYSLFGCETVYATKFVAKNNKGETVKGVVCKGLLNRTSSSVRTFDE